MSEQDGAATAGPAAARTGAEVHVHQLVQDENARTILLNVPLEAGASGSGHGDATGSFRSARPRPAPAASAGPSSPREAPSRARRLGPPPRGAPGGKATRRVRSASVGRDKKSDLHARYWGFLFENLRRAVDDLYETCEMDDSVPAAKEVILVLDNYVRDFKNLVGWFKLKREYENTPSPKRPTSLAWEVRKTSPGGYKLSSQHQPVAQVMQQRLLMAASPARRALNFDADKVVPIRKEPTLQKVEEKDTLNGTPDQKDKTEAPNEKENVEPEDRDNASQTETTSKDLPVEEASVESKAEESAQEIPMNEQGDTKEASKPSDEKPQPTKKPLGKTSNITSASVQPSKGTSGQSSSKPSFASKVLANKAATARPSSSPSPATSKTTATGTKSSSTTNKSSVTSKQSSVSSPDLRRNAVKPSGGTIDASTAKTGQRVSLVARQSLIAGSSGRTLTRAATTASISRPAGRGQPSSRPSTAASQQRQSARGSGTASSSVKSRTAPAARAADAGSKPPAASTAPTSASLPPFGSTSSVSSVGSTRSWADTVKGLRTPKSVENVSTASSASTTGPIGENDEKKVDGEREQDDGGEWESVRSRRRSRLSPFNKLIAGRSKESLVETKEARENSKTLLCKRESLDSGLKNKYSAKSRFNAPSSAASLPSLSLLKEESPSTTKTEESSKTQKKEIERKSSHLDRVIEASGDTRSSSESLSDKTVKKKRVGVSVATTTSSEAKRRTSKNVPAAKALVGGSWTAKATTKKTNNIKTSSKLSKPKVIPPKVESNEDQKEPTPAVENSTFLQEVSGDVQEPDDRQDASDDTLDDATESAIVENEAALARVEEEHEKLAKEIQETEKQEMSETDGDSDMQSVVSDREDKAVSADFAPMTPLNLDVLMQDGVPLSWADEIDLEEQLRASGETRYPGRAIQLHEKLSSPARKKEPQEAFKEHQEKQNQARLRREQFQDKKAAKLSALNTKIEEVIAHKEQLMQEQKDLLHDKMKRAEEKRQEHIEGIRRKAHMEEAKLKEIAFINELQAQNSRIDMMAHNQTVDEKHEERLAELAEERARKAEERTAKEARAEERRRQMEEKRLQSMEALRQRIKSREERIQEEQEQARKDREEAAREKARDREEKLSSVRAAEKDLKMELQEKIQQKQEDAAKRHKEKLERIRNRAFELSVLRCSAADGEGEVEGADGVPMLQAYHPKKKCAICDVLIANEVQLQSHLKGKRHKEKVIQANDGRKLSGEELRSCNLKFVVDAALNDEQDVGRNAAAKERLKAMKRRAKKLRTRMVTRSAEYEKDLVFPTKFDGPNRAKIGKAIKDLDKVCGSQGKGAWPNNALSSLERSLGEICRAFEKEDSGDRLCFFAMGGFSSLARIFHMVLEQKANCVIPMKTVTKTCRAYSLACSGYEANTIHCLKDNHLTIFSDILNDRLHVLIPRKDQDSNDEEGNVQLEPQTDPVAKSILNLLAQLLENLAQIMNAKAAPGGSATKTHQTDPADTVSRAQDQISYVVSLGIIDSLADYLQSVQDPIDGKREVGEMLLACLNFMSALAGASEVVKSVMAARGHKDGSDHSHMLQAYKATELAGLVSMLYGLLLHQGAPARDSRSRQGGDDDAPPPPPLPSYVAAVATAASRLLLRLARQDLPGIQGVLAQEGISLEFRHIASYLLWFCCQQERHSGTQKGGSGRASTDDAKSHKELLHLTIILVGYFAAGHEENQAILQSGHQPSVLQQLCNLPFPYFSQPELRAVLFPTLIAACHDHHENRAILGQEMSYSLLQEFLDSPEGGDDHLVNLVVKTKPDQ